VSDRKQRAERRAQQAAEVEASQAKFRENIDQAKRLVDESNAMLRRHLQECADDDMTEDNADV
jgi:hypothetical protein